MRYPLGNSCTVRCYVEGYPKTRISYERPSKRLPKSPSSPIWPGDHTTCAIEHLYNTPAESGVMDLGCADSVQSAVNVELVLQKILELDGTTWLSKDEG